MYRTHVDDAAATTGSVHVRQTRLGRQKGAIEVDTGEFFPVLEAEFLEWMHDLQTGVADQNVDATKGSNARVDAIVHGPFDGHIHRHAESLAACGFDLGDNSIGRRSVQIGDRYPRALPGKR